MSKQTVSDSLIDFHSVFFSLLWKSVRPETVWLLIFCKWWNGEIKWWNSTV